MHSQTGVGLIGLQLLHFCSFSPSRAKPNLLKIKSSAHTTQHMTSSADISCPAQNVCTEAGKPARLEESLKLSLSHDVLGAAAAASFRHCQGRCFHLRWPRVSAADTKQRRRPRATHGPHYLVPAGQATRPLEYKQAIGLNGTGTLMRAANRHESRADWQGG